MTENEKDEFENGETMASEFQRLGKNIKEAISSAWESEERKQLQREIKEGLSEVGQSLNALFDELGESSAAQHIKSNVEDFSDSVRSGEVRSKVRQDVVSALRKVNDEIEKISQRWGKEEDTESGQGTTGSETSE